MPDILLPFRELLFNILTFFHDSFFGSWGLAIVLLTVSVRILLLPLTLKQTRSLKAMQAVGPKMRELQKRYKDDRKKLQEEMLKFYSENKINPLAGCLPILPQLPIMIALFQVLLRSPEIKGVPFLWVADLGQAPEPILVGLMLFSTYFSQWMISTDPQQRRMMLPMSLIIAVIGWTLPAGVLLYWVTTNLWTIGQQVVQFRGIPVLSEASPPASAAAQPKEKEKESDDTPAEERRVSRRKR